MFLCPAGSVPHSFPRGLCPQLAMNTDASPEATGEVGAPAAGSERRRTHLFGVGLARETHLSIWRPWSES